MKPSCAAVRPVVTELLGEILSGPLKDTVRCHEIARLLAPRLQERLNCPVRICDGAVRYRADFLWQQAKLDSFDDIDELAVLIVHARPAANQFCGTIHSWCEVGPAGEIVVDYHNFLMVGSPSDSCQFGFEYLLLVMSRDELANGASYKYWGRPFTLFGRSFLLLPRFLFGMFLVPWITRIRLP